MYLQLKIVLKPSLFYLKKTWEQHYLKHLTYPASS